MNVSELRELLLTIDPNLTSFVGDGSTRPYTVMTPHHEASFVSDDVTEDRTVTVTIDRFSLDEDDTVARQIVDALEEARVTTSDVLRIYENDTKLHRWIIDCYVAADV